MLRQVEVKQRVRPTCVASIVAADDEEQFRQAAMINTCLWGGALNPILLYSPEREQECIRQLETFRPDYVYAFTDIPEGAPIRAHMRDWPSWPSGLFFEDEGTLSMQFCDMAPIIRSRSELVQGTPFTFPTWPDDAVAGTLYCATVGTYPPDTSPEYAEMYRALLRAHDRVLTGTQPDHYRPLREVTPIRLTLSGIQVIRPRRVLGSGGLLLGRRDSLADIADFWNLRAVGYHDLAFVPIDVDGAIELFADAAAASSLSWSLSDGTVGPLPTVDVHLGRTTTPEEAQGALTGLPGAGEEFRIALASLSPASWQDRYLHGRRCWNRETSELGLLEGRSVRFLGLAPEFEQDSYPQRFWTREVTIRRPYGEERLLGSFPALPGMQERIITWTGEPERSRIDTPAVVMDDYSPGITQHISLPTALEIVSSVVSHLGCTTEVSDAGRALEAVAERLGGIQECRMLKLRAVRAALEELARGKPMHAHHLKEIIGRALFASAADRSVGYAPSITGANIGPDLIFDWLLTNRVMRAGLKLKCEACGYSDWYPLSRLGDSYTCNACYEEQSLPRPDRLAWFYVADGFFRLRGNAKGSVAVIITIWRLMFPHMGDEIAWVPSLDLGRPDGRSEIDFALVGVDGMRGEHRLLFGEVIGADGKGAEDIAKLGWFARQLPEAYLCVSTAGPGFSDSEQRALTELRRSSSRLIVMTRDELEPYRLDHLEERSDERRFILSWDDLCAATQRKYLGGEEDPDPPSCQQ